MILFNTFLHYFEHHQTLSWFLVLIVRIINSWANATFYLPDEFYQCLEVAHRLVFGTGFLTWEWKAQLRSVPHVMVFAVVYKLLKFCRCDGFVFVFVSAPKVLTGFFGFVIDYFTYKYALVIFGSRVAGLTMLLSLTCFFNGYLGVRSFSNSVETSLTAIALWLYAKFNKEFRRMMNEEGDNHTNTSVVWPFVYFLATVVGTFVIRPTNLIIWAPFVLLFAFECVSFEKYPYICFPRFRLRFCNKYLCFTLIFSFISICALFMFSIVLDYYVYEKLTFTPYNFVQFNLVSGLSAIFGTDAWSFYFTTGLPMILVGFLIPFVIGVLFEWRRVWSLVVVIMGVFFVYSLLGHKEVRFVYPLIPVLLVVVAVGFRKYV
jgi:phosphatidylinositol glycan class B